MCIYGYDYLEERQLLEEERQRLKKMKQKSMLVLLPLYGIAIYYIRNLRSLKKKK
ncbi:MAG: hypothetical protein WCX96_01160 [Bacilli bacterium]